MTDKTGKGNAKVLSLKGTVKSTIDLPKVFETEYRPDVIQKASVAEASQERQSYGTNDRAGLNTTAEYYSRRKGVYRMTMNRGMSRLPRLKIPGGGLGRVAQVPQSRGGRRAHPPKAEKDFSKKINNKEYLLAIKSAIAATSDGELVKGEGRNHKIGDISIPLIVEKAFAGIDKTTKVIEVLEKLGLKDELERAEDKKTRTGKAKARRGRKKQKTSVLIVVGDECKLQKSAGNLPGVDVSTVDDLNVNLLAPGGYPGRMTIWLEDSFEKLNEI